MSMTTKDCKKLLSIRLLNVVKACMSSRKQCFAELYWEKARFLLAQLHIDSLAKKSNRRAIRLALEILPRNLDSTYDEALQRIENQYIDDAIIAHGVLSWIVYANRALDIREVQDALAVEPELTYVGDDVLIGEDLLTSVCLGLVTVDRDSRIVRLIHHTTQEYFERKGPNYFPDAHRNITTTYLTYLSHHTTPGRSSFGFARALKTPESLLSAYAFF